jgi:osmoprotectant transport system ATP-binding protein
MPHAIQCRNLTKRYDAGAKGPGAVNDLSMTIPAGSICVLVGPSGCGKTTSLKMVNRLIEPTSGRILLDGVDAATRNLTELRRGIGYVIQQVGLFPHQTIGENVAVVPRLLGWPAARQQERAEELLTLVGLDPAQYRDRYPSQLSGGERQRVGVARALAADPPIMLMDEPFGAVDPIVRDRLQNEFLRLQEDLAKTILFVTHDIDEAIKMGDLVAVMQVGGHLAQFGPPEEILAAPANEFVARFVGTDRALKRLSLQRVRDLPWQDAVTAHAGDDAAEARRRILADPFPYLLLIDERQRPIGWLFGVYLVFAGTERFLVEILRAKDDRFLGPFTLAQASTTAYNRGGTPNSPQRWGDYSRADVDPSRVGCAGLSGGGLRTVYLAGLDNGRQEDAENYKASTRQAFNGKALAIVASGDRPGPITVTGTATTATAPKTSNAPTVTEVSSLSSSLTTTTTAAGEATASAV